MGNTTHGANYVEGRNLADTAKLIRKDIKAAVKSGALAAGLKVSVRIERYSMGQSIRCEIKELPAGLEIANAWKVEGQHRGNDVGAHARAHLSDAGAALSKQLEEILRSYNYVRDNGEFCRPDYHFFGSVSFAHDMWTESAARITAQLEERDAKAERLEQLDADVATASAELRDAAHGKCEAEEADAEAAFEAECDDAPDPTTCPSCSGAIPAGTAVDGLCGHCAAPGGFQIDPHEDIVDEPAVDEPYESAAKLEEHADELTKDADNEKSPFVAMVLHDESAELRKEAQKRRAAARAALPGFAYDSTPEEIAAGKAIGAANRAAFERGAAAANEPSPAPGDDHPILTPRKPCKECEKLTGFRCERCDCPLCGHCVVGAATGGHGDRAVILEYDGSYGHLCTDCTASGPADDEPTPDTGISETVPERITRIAAELFETIKRSTWCEMRDAGATPELFDALEAMTKEEA